LIKERGESREKKDSVQAYEDAPARQLRRSVVQHPFPCKHAL